MAKTIKFNLICDGKPIRTIEDLQNNFSVEDIFAYYDNKLLHRWLEVRGYEKELDAVTKISTTEPIDIITELIKIFDVETDKDKILEGIYIFNYAEERKELYNKYLETELKVEHVIDDYYKGYNQVVNYVIENKNDIVKIRAGIKELIDEYYTMFLFNKKELFYKLYYHAPKAIFVMLTHNEIRTAYLPVKVKATDGKYYDDLEMGYENEKKEEIKDKLGMYKLINSMVKDAPTYLGDNLKIFSGVTDGYWKDLEDASKKYMILSMEGGDYVRPAGKSGGDLGYNDINNKFVILDGIDFKCNTATHKLMYMEV